MTDTTASAAQSSVVASNAAAFEVRPSANPLPAIQRDAALADLKFGTQFTDHMARMQWRKDEGWGDRRVEAYGPLQLDPAAAVLHYAQEIFEGLKAFKWADGSVHLFRPEANAERFNRSAHRLALPQLPVEDFVGSLEALIAADVAWVPGVEESSLYLRPFMFASEAFLGVRPAHVIDYLLIASPVGPYFPGGVKPVSIWVAQGFHRAGPGGTGDAKCGGNYAASLLPQQQAAEHGCQQVLFLDAKNDRYLEELGGMNVFVVRRDGTIETPRLTGTILEGITRSSVIQQLEDDGRKVIEKDITLDEVRAGVEDGDIAEVFACGTAAVVTPVGRLASPTFDVQINGGEAGQVTMGIRQRLTDIQYGRDEDTYGWMRRVA
ncbi:branched-chain amino acid aminotransferase [Demequina muriae]|uniref:Branched-chain-amino-acid aminotransferase n=1 Tax=Demequina muriae TaxID=3051664 RepID=A0ABT8GIG6_9MICO|nr:branched-chain amino acid aminotransferase [Demequina sp. EGI L300058]MDN4481233.1 branched-chain amino acid aminotransferase [Demequina sp. EGI L300058]